MNEKKKYVLIVSRAVCTNCGTERLLYFMPEHTYGERVVATARGTHCAYVNLLEENITGELEQILGELLRGKDCCPSANNLARIAAQVYGITCDEICGERIDTIPYTKCPNCFGNTLAEDTGYGERVMEMELPQVTHEAWEKLQYNEKKERVEAELSRRGGDQ